MAGKGKAPRAKFILWVVGCAAAAAFDSSSLRAQDAAATPETETAPVAEAPAAADSGEIAVADPGAAAPSGSIAHIVVTANSVPTDERHVGATVSVITAEELEKKQVRTLTDALREVPGFQMASMGGPGSATSLFLRGANSGHTIVLVDGAPINHPWSDTRSFESNTLLNLENIERIEVVKGPQSVRYGADAMAGVINIVTKKGDGRPTASAFVEAGSRGTVISNVETSGGNDRFDYSLGAGLYRTDGYSMAPGGKERDHSDNESASLRLGGRPVDALRLDLFARYSNASLDFDDPPYDSPQQGERESLFLRPQAKLDLLGGRWTQTAGFAYGHHDYKQDDHAPPGWGLVQHTKAYSARFDYQSDFKFADNHTLTAGFDRTREWYVTEMDAYGMPADQRPDATVLTGVYLQDSLSLGERLFLTLGVRNDHHNEFGDRTTYRATAAYLLPTGTTLRASYGTGFKAPTLYQLYDTTWGSQNPDLRPETNEAWEFGVEQALRDGRFTVGATYFDGRYKNLINWSAAGYENIGRARMRGVETFARWRVTDTFDLEATYTYLDAENLATGRQLGRRARNTFTAGAHWRFLERGDFDLRYRAADDRNDRGAVGGARMGGYGVVDASLAWKVREGFTLTARGENLFDKKYEYAAGYQTPRRAFFGGFRLSF